MHVSSSGTVEISLVSVIVLYSTNWSELGLYMCHYFILTLLPTETYANLSVISSVSHNCFLNLHFFIDVTACLNLNKDIDYLLFM